MEKEIAVQLKTLKQKMEQIPGKNGKAIRYKKELSELIELFSGLTIPKEFKDRYNLLLNKVTELNEGDNYRNIKKVDSFLPACFAFYYEVKGEYKNIVAKMMNTFMIVSILFVFVSMIMAVVVKSTVFIITSAIFLGPMVIGIRGLQKASGRGITVGLVLAEFSTLIGLGGIYFGVVAILKLNAFVSGLTTQLGLTVAGGTTTVIGIIVFLFIISSIALTIISVYYDRLHKKYKKLFV